VFSQIFFDQSCIVFGKSSYGINGNLFGQEFTYTSSVLRKFTRYPDPCDKNNFCEMYLTLPNTPFAPANNMVVNLFSQFPARQDRYMQLKEKMTSPDINFKERSKIKKQIDGLEGEYIEMNLYFGKLSDYNKNGRLEKKVYIDKNDKRTW